MCPLEIGKSYRLQLPDGQVLGRMLVQGETDGWAERPFTALPGFDQFRDLFQREAELRHGHVIPLWEQAADAIEALGIEVVDDDDEGTVHHQLRVFVEAGEAMVGGPERGTLDGQNSTSQYSAAIATPRPS